MTFYIEAILTILFIVVPSAIIAFKKESERKFKWWVLIIPIIGAILGFYTNYDAHQDAQKNQITANTNDSLYKSQLNKNLDSSKKIIDSLNKSIGTTASILRNSKSIMDRQNAASTLLTKQLDSTSKVLHNSNLTIENTNKTLFEIARANNELKNVKISFAIKYFYDDPSYKEINWNDVYFPEGAFVLAKKQLKIDSVNKFIAGLSPNTTAGYLLTGKETVFWDRDAFIVTEIKGKDTVVKWIEFNLSNRIKKTKYDKFIPTIQNVMLQLQSGIKKITLENNQNDISYDPDLMFVPKNNTIVNEGEITYAGIDFIQHTVTEYITIPMIRDFSNNSIKSILDLQERYLILWLGFPIKSKVYDVRLYCGEDYSNCIWLDRFNPISMDRKDAHRLVYHFPSFK